MLCVDEKSQIQALDRSQPMFPMRPGQAARRSHDYKRHGVTSLFAALDMQPAGSSATAMRRHRAKEFRKFLDAIEVTVPDDLDVHLVMDNYATHKTPLIRNWLAKTAALARASDANEFILDQSGRTFLCAHHRAAKSGVASIAAWLRYAPTSKSFIELHNANPKPFRWTKSPDDILSLDRTLLRLQFASQGLKCHELLVQDIRILPGLKQGDEHGGAAHGGDAKIGPQGLPGWAEMQGREAIARTFTFKDFNEAFGFMARAALVAEKATIIPEWRNVYKTVEVVLATHDAGGVTAARHRPCDQAMNGIAEALGVA